MDVVAVRIVDVHLQCVGPRHAGLAGRDAAGFEPRPQRFEIVALDGEMLKPEIGLIGVRPIGTASGRTSASSSRPPP
jgi:hypothetical protein